MWSDKMEYNNGSQEEYIYLQHLVKKYIGISDMNLNDVISPTIIY